MSIMMSKDKKELIVTCKCLCGDTVHFCKIEDTDDEEKEYAFSEAKAIADKFDADKYLNMPRPYPITLGQKMYGYAMPKQYTMLKEAPYVIIPLFRSKE